MLVVDSAMANQRVFAVTYESVSLEIIPKDVFGAGLPDASVRLVLSSYIPAAICISSFVLYWFIYLPILLPATAPSSEEARARLKVARQVHNFALFAYSGACCTAAAAFLYSDGQLFSWEALLCRPVEGTWLRIVSCTFTLSKLWEWGDTAFLVWFGRAPEFLHRYHHATTFWLFCFVMNLPGPEKFGMLLNGGVHTLMYWHYWKPWPKPLVPFITVLQILQLSFVTYAWHATPRICQGSAFAEAPTVHWVSYLTPYCFVPVFLYLFVVLFLKRFILGNNNKKVAKITVRKHAKHECDKVN